MKKIILLFLLSATTNLLWAQTNPDTLIAQASRLEKQDQWAAAAALYGQAFDLMPNPSDTPSCQLPAPMGQGTAELRKQHRGQKTHPPSNGTPQTTVW